MNRPHKEEPMKVLVVDDEKLIVKGIRFSLEQDGMEVDCAYDGEEALQKIKENEYSLKIKNKKEYNKLHQYYLILSAESLMSMT